MLSKFTITLRGILLLLSFTPIQTVLAQQQISEEKAIAERTLLLINNYRQSKGLAPLVSLPAIYEECLAHCRKMAEEKQVNHDNFDQRVKNVCKEIRCGGGSAENVAYNYEEADPAMRAFNQWRKSSGHHKNMLGKEYTHTGLAVVRGKEGAYYFTQLFIQVSKR